MSAAPFALLIGAGDPSAPAAGPIVAPRSLADRVADAEALIRRYAQMTPLPPHAISQFRRCFLAPDFATMIYALGIVASCDLEFLHDLEVMQRKLRARSIELASLDRADTP